jgi:putative addiction module component (TIGR02574 family)
MTDVAAQLLADALRLADSERGDIAARLLESLDPGIDEDAETAWGEELIKRIAELREGTVKPISWPEARRRILEDMDEPDSV